jgi:hypothetical protein
MKGKCDNHASQTSLPMRGAGARPLMLPEGHSSLGTRYRQRLRSSPPRVTPKPAFPGLERPRARQERRLGGCNPLI